jgi:hypothetical protein
MNIEKLSHALAQMKTKYEKAITTASFGGEQKENGQEAKQALIRSSGLIFPIHEIAKEAISDALKEMDVPHQPHPPLGSNSPELSVTGLIKRKQQDVVMLIGNTKRVPEKIDDGPLEGSIDDLGRSVSERAIVIGVRSQLSSVAKNFDTLMERAFAETLNLRLRLPKLVMGEVYLLPIYEYNDAAMKTNEVAFKPSPINIRKFIRTFISISGRTPDDSQIPNSYKYERSVLLLADFRPEIPEIYYEPSQLMKVGVDSETAHSYANLSPVEFASDIVRIYHERHSAS